MRSLGFLVFFPLLPAIVGCPGMDSQDGVGPAGPARSFILGVEQDGRMLPIRDHQVVLKRKPFVIVVVFPVPDAVLVIASFRPDSFEAARRTVQRDPGVRGVPRPPGAVQPGQDPRHR